MNYYSHSNNKILIAHFPGNTKETEKDLLNEFSNRIFNKPNNIGIICPITKDEIPNSPLIKQLNLNNYDYYNYIKDYNIIWHRQDKAKYVLESLKMCKEEYSLILDGNDVAILSDLDNIIEKLNSYDKKIIYNATIWMYPHQIIEYVEDRGQYGNYCFLNAGCCIGKTNDLINFYQEVCRLIDNSRKINSEQYYIRKIFDKHQDEVFFDYDCRIFQIWHKQKYEYKDGNCYLI